MASPDAPGRLLRCRRIRDAIDGVLAQSGRDTRELLPTTRPDDDLDTSASRSRRDRVDRRPTGFNDRTSEDCLMLHRRRPRKRADPLPSRWRAGPPRIPSPLDTSHPDRIVARVTTTPIVIIRLTVAGSCGHDHRARRRQVARHPIPWRDHCWQSRSGVAAFTGRVARWSEALEARQPAERSPRVIE
jgi:hypothetical protein